MKLQDLLRHVADNVEAGEVASHGLMLWGSTSVASKPEDIAWDECGEYELKPATHTVNGFKVPVAMSVAPESYYWVPDLFDAPLTYQYRWSGDNSDQRALKRNLCFSTPEDAAANAKAMLGINPSTPIEEC